ncbi:MAG: leucine--tRNA ligase [Phycisphaerales bacterium]|nr:leucine--tRNA ligase [Phycisphaerales bacterium]
MTDRPENQADAGPACRYNAAMANAIEEKWQKLWAEQGVFRQPNPGEGGFDSGKPKFYCLDMFPYPSGSGLHVGHPEGYTATDILCRYKRMTGHSVLHPMGWDAFGLPAEQHAIRTGEHPASFTRKTIDNFRRQLQRFGFSYDWSREVATIDPEYYRWTQWIFLQIYNAWYDPSADKARPISALIKELENGTLGVNHAGEVVRADSRSRVAPAVTGSPVGVLLWHRLTAPERREVIDSMRLAYIEEKTVNWCPKLGTALANEEVIDGRSERGGFPVFQKPLRQWLFRITAFADRLLRDLEKVDWPASTKAQQAEWIGRSEGAEIDFEVEGWKGGEEAPPFLRVFTTRPDTLFGATYMVVAPEHPLVESVLEHPPRACDPLALRQYAEKAQKKSEQDRKLDKKKTGVFTGVYAINPATGEKIPVWTSDYVVMGYGTGAIMAVPAHDERDFEFASKFGLPIVDVVYDHARAAMAHFAARAPRPLTQSNKWDAALIEFLQQVVNEDATPERFTELLDAVAARADRIVRREGDGPHTVWFETLRSMGCNDWESFRTLFAERAAHRASAGAYSRPGYAWNSTNAAVSLDGLSTEDAKAKIIGWIESQEIGRGKVQYKLRDWLFSRQRYWGEPFPIVFDEDGDHHPVGEDSLPVELPPLTDYEPEESDEPRPLLAKAGGWLQTTAGEAGVKGLDPETPVTREANTMPGLAGSCWYYLRYCDPKNNERFVGKEAEQYWLGDGVDLYIGGAEHAVLHLLYARFWHKALYDLGHVSSEEPFRKLFHQGLITSFAFQRADKSLVPTDEVEEVREGEFSEKATGEPVKQIVAKMSKSLKNVVNPDDVIAEFGADTFRLYEMYMGPLEASKPWNTRDIGGLFRFCQRAWRMLIDEESGQPATQESPDDEVEKRLHRAIAKVGEDIEKLSFNTAIAAMIEFVNFASAAREKSGVLLTPDQGRRFALILAPFAPHLGEELWSRLGGGGLAYRALWPEHDEALLVDDAVEIAVQVMGKVRHRMTVPADAGASQVETLVMADSRVKELIEGKTVQKVIVVPGRMVNIVAK